jgi:hypothetical protein
MDMPCLLCCLFMLVQLSYVIQWLCFHFVCTFGTLAFEFWCRWYQVQLAMHKFDFRFVQNETSNQERHVGSIEMIEPYVYDGIYLFSSRSSSREQTCHVTAVCSLHDAELPAELSSRAIRRNSILQALHQAVPSWLRKPQRCCSCQRLHTFIHITL